MIAAFISLKCVFIEIALPNLSPIYLCITEIYKTGLPISFLQNNLFNLWVCVLNSKRIYISP